MIDAVHDALSAAKICSYAQGMNLLRAASGEYGVGASTCGEIARIWKGGCIIRARLPRHAHAGVRARAPTCPTCCSTPSRPWLSEARSAAGGASVSAAVAAGRSGAGDVGGPRVLRQLSQRAPAAEPHAGPARLLRRAHLSARGSAGRRVRAHRLAERDSAGRSGTTAMSVTVRAGTPEPGGARGDSTGRGVHNHHLWRDGRPDTAEAHARALGCPAVLRCTEQPVRSDWHGADAAVRREVSRPHASARRHGA